MPFNCAAESGCGPLRVFGDRLFGWHSSNATMNPEPPKSPILKRILTSMIPICGQPSTAAYSVEKLNHYLDASFYNAFAYGSDMHDMEATVRYLIKKDQVKNIVLSLSLSCAAGCDWDTGDLTGILHADVDGGSKFLFYAKYLFANPRYSFSKIYNYLNDTYLPQAFDVFLEDTGVYDKSVRDAEPIGDLGEYLAQNSSFTQIGGEVQSLDYIDEYLSALKSIVERCREKDVNLIVIFEPTYTELFKNTMGPGLRDAGKNGGAYRLLVFSLIPSARSPAITTIFTMCATRWGTGDLPYFRGRLQNDSTGFRRTAYR